MWYGACEVKKCNGSVPDVLTDRLMGGEFVIAGGEDRSKQLTRALALAGKLGVDRAALFAPTAFYCLLSARE